VSLAARFLIVDRPTWTMGVGVRVDQSTLTQQTH